MLGSWLEMYVLYVQYLWRAEVFPFPFAEEIGKPSGIARIFVRIVVIYVKIYHQ